MRTLAATVEAALDEWDRRPHAECREVVHHGPGHQSTTHCFIDGDVAHEVHTATFGEFSDFGMWKHGQQRVSNEDDEVLMAEFEAEAAIRAASERRLRAEAVAKAIRVAKALRRG